MTACYAAFLRGINVGGRIIKMTDLRACFESLGLASVKTVLATGNVLFESGQPVAKLKGMIESGLSAQFEYAAKVQVIELQKLQAIVDAYPFASEDSSLHDYVVFMENGLAATLAAEAADGLDENETIQLGEGVVYWRVPKGQTLASPFAKYLTKAKYKDFSTTRNLKTLRKLV